MKVNDFCEPVKGLLKKAEKDGDKWCIVFFSKSQDAYRESFNLDSGDALIIIQSLIRKYGIDPYVLATMKMSEKSFKAVINKG